jgi:uncharacterized protein YbjQ (UPF0145 family)
MIATTTASRIGGYHIAAYKGTAQGESFDELVKSAKALGSNAILNTCFDNALDVDTLFHGAAVIIEPIPLLLRHLAGGTTASAVSKSTEVTEGAI